MMDHKVILQEREAIDIIDCPICGSGDYEIFKKIENNDYDSEDILPEKTISICRNCGLIYQNPCISQEAMQTIYRKYEDKISDSKQSFEIPEIENKMRVQEAIKLFESPKKILEAGCGEGNFLIEMARYDFRCVGIDPSEANFDKFKKYNFEKNIIYLVDYFENIDSEEKYDVIFHFFTLEHSYNPKDFLLKARGLIGDEGIMIFEVPDVKKFIALPFGVDLFPYQHVVHFYYETLENLLNMTGWEISAKITLGLSSKSYGVKIAAKPAKSVVEITRNYYDLSKQILNKYFDRLDTNAKMLQKRLDAIIEKTYSPKKGIVIFGAGENGQFIVENTNILKQVNQIWFCDNNKYIYGKQIKGIKVYSPSEIRTLNFSAVIVASIDCQEDMVRELYKLNIDKEKIFKLYDFNYYENQV